MFKDQFIFIGNYLSVLKCQDFIQLNHFLTVKLITIQQTFTCSRSTIETLEKGVKYIQS